MTDQAARELALKKWKRIGKKQRSEILSAAVNARWEKWRAENPEKAAASEARRASRAAKKRKAIK